MIKEKLEAITNNFVTNNRPLLEKLSSGISAFLDYGGTALTVLLITELSLIKLGGVNPAEAHLAGLSLGLFAQGERFMKLIPKGLDYLQSKRRRF